MPTEADKIAAATLTAAMLRTLEPTGSVQEDAKARARAIDFASRLYRDLLASIQPAGEEPAPTSAVAEPA